VRETGLRIRQGRGDRTVNSKVVAKTTKKQQAAQLFAKPKIFATPSRENYYTERCCCLCCFCMRLLMIHFQKVEKVEKGEGVRRRCLPWQLFSVSHIQKFNWLGKILQLK